jgi:hypothetical protein
VRGRKKIREQRTENKSVREITENGKNKYIYILIEGLIGLFTNDFFVLYVLLTAHERPVFFPIRFTKIRKTPLPINTIIKRSLRHP